MRRRGGLREKKGRVTPCLGSKKRREKKNLVCLRSGTISSLTANARATMRPRSIQGPTRNPVILDHGPTIITKARVMVSMLIRNRNLVITMNNIADEEGHENIPILVPRQVPPARPRVVPVRTVVPTLPRLRHPLRLRPPTVVITAPQRVVLDARTPHLVAVNPSTHAVT
jgi:hypothetical protein